MKRSARNLIAAKSTLKESRAFRDSPASAAGRARADFAPDPTRRFLKASASGRKDFSAVPAAAAAAVLRTSSARCLAAWGAGAASAEGAAASKILRPKHRRAAQTSPPP